MGAQYVTILSDHSAHLRSSFQRHGGEIVDTQGDAFFVAFAHAEPALLAAAEAQLALHGHPWPEGGTRAGAHRHPQRHARCGRRAATSAWT